MPMLVEKIYKRNNNIVPFDPERIINAIFKAMRASKEGSRNKAAAVAAEVVTAINERCKQKKSYIPHVEEIQDLVEKKLMEYGFFATAKNYILYRKERAQLRNQKIEIPEHFKKLAEESKKYFHDSLSEFVYLRTYARWIEEEQRRETWIETVDRYMNFMRSNLKNKFTENEYNELREAILNQEVMPSMRLLQFAGRAAKATNVCAYNCSFIAPSKIKDFGEVMYISMCGTGVGFSVESTNIQALPQIKRQTGKVLPTHIIEDSKEGWCKALVLGMKTWVAGKDIKFDYSKLRPAGARLKTMGGKSSGPTPLRELLDFTRALILRRQGRRLTNINAHDILCKIGEIVVAGGVRRSAMISLSDLDDAEMRDAKKGQFYFQHPQRSMANNSAIYLEKPTNTEFMEEWLALMKSGSGERGIFNRSGLATAMPQRRVKLLRDLGYIYNNTVTGIIGTNPCGEILLRSKSFCNLTEIVARENDDEKSLLRKARLATMLGTYQATLINFSYLSKEWKENCEQERLLGVSITGQWDCETVRNPAMLQKLKQKTIEVNKEYAKRLNINPAAAITCVKPSGTASLVVGCASGMHARYAPYYIRRIRISATDALFKTLRAQQVPYYPEVGQSENTATTFVLEFPVKAPEHAIFRSNLTALDQLEYWKMVKTNYTEHNPSVTITVAEDEWIKVANWIAENWDIIGGLSFLPRSNHVYRLAPYEEIDEKRYEELKTKLQNIDFTQLVYYERSDETEVKRELACVGGACDIDS